MRMFTPPRTQPTTGEDECVKRMQPSGSVSALRFSTASSHASSAKDWLEEEESEDEAERDEEGGGGGRWINRMEEKGEEPEEDDRDPAYYEHLIDDFEEEADE